MLFSVHKVLIFSEDLSYQVNHIKSHSQLKEAILAATFAAPHNLNSSLIMFNNG
jgi:hypothetical protein